VIILRARQAVVFLLSLVDDNLARAEDFAGGKIRAMVEKDNAPPMASRAFHGLAAE
jgi:hypothetical protein